MSVSMDDAWGSLLDPPAPPPRVEPPPPPPVAAAVTAPTPRQVTFEDEKHPHLSKRRRRTAASDRVAVDQELPSVLDEMRELRDEMHRLARRTTSMLYIAAIVIIILLGVVVQSQRSLNYTARCLLWHTMPR